MRLFAYIFLYLMFSCSSLTVENEEVVPVDDLTPATIKTELDIIDVHVDQQAFDHMYERYGEDIIIEGYLDWYGSKKDLLLDSVAVKMEIRGSGSANYVLKSIGFVFEEDVDNVTAPVLNPNKVLDIHSLKVLKAVRVRNSGSDLFGTMFKDLAYTQMAIDANLDIDVMYGEPLHVFVNGSYFGLLNARNDTSVPGIAALREAESGAITRMDVDTDNQNLEFKEGDEQLAQRLLDAIYNGKTDTLWQLVDINSFIDYIIFEDYIGNHDWPGNNVEAYSLNGEPFRFFMFDLDRAADEPRRHEIPQLEYLDYDIAKLYRALVKHPDFLDMLESRQAEIYQILSPDQFNQIVSDFAARIENDILYQIGKYNIPDSKLHWRLNVEEIKRDFKIRDSNARKKYGL